MKRFRRRLRQAREIVRRWWWIASGERQRVVDELDRYKSAADLRFKQMCEYRDALHVLQVEHRGASVDLLRQIADEIDCGPDCETFSPIDWETGVGECGLTDLGQCPFDHACGLRELADALETKAALGEG